LGAEFLTLRYSLLILAWDGGGRRIFQCGCDIESPASDSEFGACDHCGQATAADRKRYRDAGKVAAVIGEALAVVAIDRRAELSLDRIDADRRRRAVLLEFDLASSSTGRSARTRRSSIR
jgi:hypothetical protein